MIDIESQVFTAVREGVLRAFPKASVISASARTPPKLPCVTVVETDNATYSESQTSSCAENHVTLSYDVNVYSASASGKRAECKALLSAADDVFLSLGFRRALRLDTPNADDNVYRMTARYIATASKDHRIYRG